MKDLEKNMYYSPNSKNYCMNLYNLICFCLLCSAWIPQYKGDKKLFSPYMMYALHEGEYMYALNSHQGEAIQKER